MTRISIPEHVVFRPFGKEMVVLNLKTGQYHGLNHTGGRMLEVLAEVNDTDVAAGMIAREFDQPLADVSRDLAELCDDLAQRSLVVLDSAEPPAGGVDEARGAG